MGKTFGLVVAALAFAGITACSGNRDAEVTADAVVIVDDGAAVTREITHIAGDVYRFQNNRHFSVFMVTPDGIIVTDPINESAATWLEAELDQMFGVPVRYVIYSHHHGDHASGGAVFADTAVFIGHVNMAAALAQGDASTEAVRPPDTVYTDQMSLSFGGKRVELHYLGRSHSDNMTVLLFPEERVAFAVDFVSVKRLPFRDLSEGYLPDWSDAIAALEALDFDILAPGHGPLGVKQDAVDHRHYLEALTDAVGEGIAAGRSVEELQETILLKAYADWGQYEAWRGENIAGAYRILTEGE